MIEKYDDDAPKCKEGGVSTASKEEIRLPSLLIEYDPNNKGFRWKFDGNIPTDALIGAMELLKSCLIDQQKALIQQAMQGQMQMPKIVVPNGQRMPKLRM